SDFSLSADFDYFVRSRMVNFQNLSDNASLFEWDFGDGMTSTLSSPRHAYTRGKRFTVRLQANNGCEQAEVIKEIDVSVNRAMPEDGFMGFNIYPNPRSDQLNIDLYTEHPKKLSVRIVNLEGKSLYEELLPISKGSNEIQVDIRSFPNGIFLVQVYDGERSLGSKRFVHF
ncbi:MAG: T9SS type A sorting domain-containing protein, partial [Bacteroidota bacterium]